MITLETRTPRLYVKISLLALLLFCATLIGSQNVSARALGGGGSEEDFAVAENVVEKWAAQDGKIVHTLTVNGLRWTRRQAIEWMVGTKEGQAFKATTLASDLQVLFNTGNLYDLTGDVQPNAEGTVDVTINLKDKWTLFPVLGGQGGGGSLTIGGGVFESNLLGYMANASLFVWTFNGTTSYDVNFNQEYFHGTQTMWSLDVQDSIEPQNPRNYDGTSHGEFAWRREQKEIMLGTHADGPLRAMFYASLFRDSVFKTDPDFHPVQYDGYQQRFYPKLIYGRVDWTNYLEDGFELTLQPSVANVFGGGHTYAQVELDFKRVFIVGRKRQDNVAFYLSTSHMGEGGPNYIYNVGGYYNVRGYADMREYGRHTAIFNAEYRPYLFGYRWQLFNADLMAVQAAFFTDVGSAWGDSTLTGDQRAQDFRPLWSAGAGLRINMVKFAGAIVRLDVARTISPDEGVGFSFGVGQFF